QAVKAINTIGIVGAGAMGRGIVQIAAQAGLNVRLFDVSADAVTAATQALSKTWETLSQKGKLTPADAQAAFARISPAQALT
uniref:3-hydroxyacyl-CoA dehydrogenase NAD-binding domain-containing protein n=1 Tax=Salmonella enterica TaxID=28901 RepID=UPI002666AFCD